MAKGGNEQDLYAILGITRSTDEETVRKTYRQLARRYHPDVNPGDKVSVQISEARTFVVQKK